MHPILQQFEKRQKRALAQAISMVENEQAGYEELLLSLPSKNTPVIGITGPPGAGKSTLISALTKHMTDQGLHVGIVAIDPSSPFNHGSLMGDRVRMSEHFLHPNVFIRSMASRGSLGGLSPKILEATDVMRAAWFDFILIETVGVGQSEVEIASLADTTIVTLVPEAGDDIQTIKSGVMEIADIFVLNKADRDGAATFFKNLTILSHSHATPEWEIPVVKTIASKNEGLNLLLDAIVLHGKSHAQNNRKAVLLAEKALTLIKTIRTKDVVFTTLLNDITQQLENKNFNLYSYVSTYKK